MVYWHFFNGLGNFYLEVVHGLRVILYNELVWMLMQLCFVHINKVFFS